MPSSTCIAILLRVGAILEKLCGAGKGCHEARLRDFRAETGRLQVAQHRRVHLHQHFLARLRQAQRTAVPLQPAQRDEVVDGLLRDVAGAAARQGVHRGEQRILQGGVDLGECGNGLHVVFLPG